MNKKIAVIVKDRQDEALRMSIGLTLVDDEVDIFFIDEKLRKNKNNKLNIETSKELGIGLFSNCEESDEVAWLSTNEMTKKLLEYDHVLPY